MTTYQSEELRGKYLLTIKLTSEEAEKPFSADGFILVTL